MKNNKLMILGLTCCCLCFSTCKKKDTKQDPTPTPPATTPTGAFEFHLHTNIDSNEVDAYNIIYTTSAGRKFSLSIAQLYISEIQLVKSDGSLVDFSGKRILKLLEAETYLVGNVAVGNYKSIKFKVGLDPTTNQLSPAAPSDSALLNKPAMWFSNPVQPDGYVFLNVQGKLDTTAGATGSIAQMQPFVFKIGTNANYKQVTMPDKNFTITDGQLEVGHIIIDYTKLFNGLVLNQPANLSVTSAAANTTSPATTIATNIPLMFTYEE